MATIRELFDELNARRARLAEAEGGGWRDAIPSERENVREFEQALFKVLVNSAATLVAAAGDVNLGELPSGIGLHFSSPLDEADPAE